VQLDNRIDAFDLEENNSASVREALEDLVLMQCQAAGPGGRGDGVVEEVFKRSPRLLGRWSRSRSLRNCVR
jgi:hypothetical protein